MKTKTTPFNHDFNVKFNLGFVLRINPKNLQKIKDFIESLEDVTVVHSQISGNRLYIREED